MHLWQKAGWLLLAALVWQGAGAEPHRDVARTERLFWQVTAAGTLVHFNDEGAPYRLSLGAGYPLAGHLSLIGSLVYAHYHVNAIADVNPEVPVEGGQSHSLGVDLHLRWTFREVRRARYFLEGGAGLQVMLDDPPFPADGSHENFTLLLGPGVLLPLAEDRRLRASVQWFHLSNGDSFGQNSGYDGLQLAIGFEW